MENRISCKIVCSHSVQKTWIFHFNFWKLVRTTTFSLLTMERGLKFTLGRCVALVFMDNSFIVCRHLCTCVGFHDMHQLPDDFTVDCLQTIATSSEIIKKKVLL